jgi:hypothetical protein
MMLSCVIVPVQGQCPQTTVDGTIMSFQFLISRRVTMSSDDGRWCSVQHSGHANIAVSEQFELLFWFVYCVTDKLHVTIEIMMYYTEITIV